MTTMLRNLARRWANRMLVRSNDTLRRNLIAAEARIALRDQAMSRAEDALADAAAELAEVTGRLTAMTRANLRMSARIGELEQVIVAMGAEAARGAARGVLDEAWPDVAAVAGPEAGPAINSR